MFFDGLFLFGFFLVFWLVGLAFLIVFFLLLVWFHVAFFPPFCFTIPIALGSSMAQIFRCYCNKNMVTICKLDMIYEALFV